MDVDGVVVVVGVLPGSCYSYCALVVMVILISSLTLNQSPPPNGHEPYYYTSFRVVE